MNVPSMTLREQKTHYHPEQVSVIYWYFSVFGLWRYSLVFHPWKLCELFCCMCLIFLNFLLFIYLVRKRCVPIWLGLGMEPVNSFQTYVVEKSGLLRDEQHMLSCKELLAPSLILKKRGWFPCSPLSFPTKKLSFGDRLDIMAAFIF